MRSSALVLAALAVFAALLGQFALLLRRDASTEPVQTVNASQPALATDSGVPQAEAQPGQAQQELQPVAVQAPVLLEAARPVLPGNAPNGRQKRVVSLVKVDIESTPTALVSARGKKGCQTPCSLQLASGRHWIELVGRNNAFRTRRSVLVSESMKPVVFSLQHGQLDFRISPWAYVSVDGVALGASPVATQTLWEGQHAVLLERPELNYRETLTVSVEPGQLQILRKVITEKVP